MVWGHPVPGAVPTLSCLSMVVPVKRYAKSPGHFVSQDPAAQWQSSVLERDSELNAQCQPLSEGAAVEEEGYLISPLALGILAVLMCPF